MGKEYQDSFIEAVSQLEMMQLKYFVSVAENLNFSRAAEELYVTQPLLSQQISALEKTLNVKLIERTTKSVNLTPYGVYFLKQAKQILQQSEKTVERLRTISNMIVKSEMLEIACDTLVERSILTSCLYSLGDNYPKLDVTVRKLCFPDVLHAVKQKIVPLGFTFCSLHHPLTGVNTKILLQDEYILLTARPKELIWDFKDMLRHIDGKPVMVPNRDSRMLTVTKNFLKHFGIRSQPLFYHNIEDLCVSVETGLGFTIIPKRKFRYYINSNVLSYSLGNYDDGMLNYVACWTGELEDPHINYLLNYF